MPLYRYIDDFTIGDTYKLIRNITQVPDEALITDAYWTVKAELTDPDESALFQIHINIATSDNGVILGYADGSWSLQFTVTPEDSLLMDSAKTYYYDVHVNLNNGEKYKLENGKLFTDQNVTQVH
jgi:hypothetical protein